MYTHKITVTKSNGLVDSFRTTVDALELHVAVLARRIAKGEVAYYAVESI
jgi:hypothetical protein